MSTPVTRTSRLELVVTEGPDEGLRAPLDLDRLVMIGRSAKGLTLGDPLVSIYHAEITWVDGEPVLADVGSATGTMLNGERLGPDASRTLVEGDAIRVGESTIRVRSRRGALPLALFGLSVVLLSVIGTAGLAVLRGPSLPIRSGLVWDVPIRQGDAASPELHVSTGYMRQRGLDLATHRILRVTDFDADGTDEVWLRGPLEQLVVTFDDMGEWRELGRLPLGCVDADRVGGAPVIGFPGQTCPGVYFHMVDGRYQAVRQDAPVAWVRVPASPTSPGKVVPYRLGLRHPEALSGFLSLRGVPEAVSWVLCDGAHEGLAAQARTERGQVVPLSYGCLSDVKVEGTIRGDVLAVALTAGGRSNLLDEMVRFEAGNTDGLFLDRPKRVVLEEWSAEPGYLQGGSWVEFAGHDLLFEAAAPEGDLPPLRGGLVSSPQASASSPAVTATLLSRGKARLDPPGCEELELRSSEWRCELSTGCLSGSTFLTVREVGCGAPRDVLSVPYRGGEFDTTVGDLQVRAVVQAHQTQGALEVLRARVAYRTRTVH